MNSYSSMHPNHNPSSQYHSSSSMRPTNEGDSSGWFDWAYKGVDHSLPGNGGPECRDFLSLSQRCWESAIASLVGLIALVYAYPRLRLPVPCPGRYKCGEPLGKRILLLLMCLTFGIELGFKFSTRQVIWIGNPCHVASMLQIFILAAPPSRMVTAAFRLHMHMLTGAPIAILFPVINTRLLPFETGVYFIQHILMLVIPFYLMKIGDPYIPEDVGDFKWAFTSFGFLYIYHFLPLQYLAYHSQVNLNNMLCPAVSDPFHGKYYRLFAIVHQIILIPTLGKVFVLIAQAFRILPPNCLPDAPFNEVLQQQQACNGCENDECALGSSPQGACCVPDDECCDNDGNMSQDSGISHSFSNRQPSSINNAPSVATTVIGGGTGAASSFRSYKMSGATGTTGTGITGTGITGTTYQSQAQSQYTQQSMGTGTTGTGMASSRMQQRTTTGTNFTNATSGFTGTTQTGDGDGGTSTSTRTFVTRRLVNGKMSGDNSRVTGATTIGGGTSQGVSGRMTMSEFDNSRTGTAVRSSKTH